MNKKGITLDKQWVGFDLDECIAEFDYEKWKHDNNWIGEPIPKMTQLIKELCDAGFWVKIFTARAGDPSVLPSVRKWINKYIGYDLEITNVKSDTCGAIFDDRAYNCQEGLFQFSEDIHFESLYPEKITHVFEQLDKSSEKMTLDEYQKLSRETAQYPSIGKSFVYPAIGLAGETGEVLEKIKKIFRDNNGVISEEMKEDLKKELGDCLWYVTQLAFELDISLEEVAKTNIQKLSSRKTRNKLQGSGDNR